MLICQWEINKHRHGHPSNAHTHKHTVYKTSKGKWVVNTAVGHCMRHACWTIL